VLGLDPRHWPVGTKLVILPPGYKLPITPWYTYDEAALLLKRNRRTIQNLVSKHRLEHVTYWDGRGDKRRRVTDLSPATMRRLAILTGRPHWITPPDDSDAREPS
jgi:hypothetical protein